MTTLAFEFATGAGKTPRLYWHADQLCRLADEVRRPLTLIVRGGKTVLTQLRRSYAEVSFLDATPFFKAVHRQMAYTGKNGKLTWRPMAGTGREAVSEILEYNFQQLAQVYTLGPISGDEHGN